MINNNSQTIGDRIKISREKMGLSQSDLSRIMCLSRTMCGQWERNTSVPSTLHLSKLADMLGVSFEYLAKGVEADFEIKFSLAAVDNQSQEKILTAKLLTLFEQMDLSQKQDLVNFLNNMIGNSKPRGLT